MPRKDRMRGKALELHVGRMFGGRRRRNGEGIGYDDCVNLNGSDMPIAFECKAYDTLQLRTVWVEQAIRNARGRPWAIAQRPKNSRRVYATIDLEFLHWLARRAGLITEPMGDEIAKAMAGVRADSSTA